MCCNADILFCVVVLHWVTSHDRPTTHPSTHDTDGQHPRTIGTASLATDKIMTNLSLEPAGLSTTDPAIWPFGEPVEGAKVAVKTECVSDTIGQNQSRPARVLHKKSGTLGGDDEGEDEVELRRIHVSTYQTREVEGKTSDGGSGSEDGHWEETAVTVEKMV